MRMFQNAFCRGSQAGVEQKFPFPHRDIILNESLLRYTVWLREFLTFLVVSCKLVKLTFQVHRCMKINRTMLLNVNENRNG